MTTLRKRAPSLAKKESANKIDVSNLQTRPRKRVAALWVFLALIAGLIIARHPEASSFASDLLPPADKLLADLDNWGNFTVTSRIRSAISDMFNSSLLSTKPDVPFYIDVISDSNSTTLRPAVFIPGYITSGLEIWQSLPCARSKFRERIWGTASMVKLLLTDAKCWVQHMLLHPITNHTSVHFTDPPGVRIRASSGLGAADYVIGDYWVWNPIIEALGYAGYDETKMSMMSYDWRFPLRDLEHRTRYFSRLKHEIEKLYAINANEPVLVVTHSFGAKVWFFFIQWISFHFSPQWIDKHVAVTYNIAPVYLGVPKAISSLLSGDTRDTAQMGALSSLVDAVLPPTERIALTTSWGSIFDMRPLGGPQVWKDPMLYLQVNNSKTPVAYSVDSAVSLLLKTDAMIFHAQHQDTRKNDMLRCPITGIPIECYKDEWTDALASPLPRIFNMTIWAVYGVGIPTEIGYNYTLTSNFRDNKGYKINTTVSDLEQNIVNGVLLGDGDGTVPLQSLGYVPAIAWRHRTLNPSNISVYVRELVHGETYSVLGRSSSVGGSSVDHVDIMGNKEVIRDILHLALGMEILDHPLKRKEFNGEILEIEKLRL